MIENTPHAKAFSFQSGDNLPIETIDSLSYVDTNFLLDLNNENSPFHSDCKNFIATLEQVNKYIVYSPWTLNELKRILRFRYAKDSYNVKSLKDIDNLSIHQRKDINTQSIYDANNLIESLNHIAIQIEIDSKTVEKQADLIAIESGMQPDDAKHISIGLSNEINSFITSDAGFLEFKNGINNINVFGASNKISRISKSNTDQNRLKFYRNK